MSKEKIEVGDWVRLTGAEWKAEFPEYVQVTEIDGDFIRAGEVGVIGDLSEFPGNGLFTGDPEYDCEWVHEGDVPDESAPGPSENVKGTASSERLEELTELLTHDPVDPKHYQFPSGVELIDIVRHMGYLEGNILKYVTRYKQKNGVEDLLKARKYLNWLIEDAEKV